MPSTSLLHRRSGFRQVVVVTGHMTDAPDRPTPRFPDYAAGLVRSKVGRRFDAWGIGRTDLLICGGARGADLLCATEARVRGATVWLLLAKKDQAFEADSVAGADPAWIDMFRDMLQRTPSWDASQIGVAEDADDLYAQTNAWMLDVATEQRSDAPCRVIAIWNGHGGDGPGGSADLVAQAEGRGMTVDLVRPLPRSAPDDG